MRRIVVAAAALAALLAGTATPADANATSTAAPTGKTSGTAAPTAAKATGTSGGWVPAPTPPFDSAAGVNCDFALHAEPVVDQVVTKVLQRNTDGTIRRDAFKGALIVRVTNTGTGESYDADASGSAVVDHAADGGQTWYVVGPILLGVRDGQGNVPRGLWIVDGVYRLRISATGYRTLTMVSGHLDNVCDHL